MADPDNTKSEALKEEIYRDALAEFPFQPLPGQDELLRQLAAFYVDRPQREVFVVNGHAGSGKTSLIGAFLRALRKRKAKTKVLAPTGRAAKVAERLSGQPGSTIHRHIYRLDLSSGAPSYSVGYNNAKDMLYIVDEASMITGRDQGGLLRLLLSYVYQGEGCTAILIGDSAQLPPVGYEKSPALSRRALESLGFGVRYFRLSKTARQAAGSGILYNALLARRQQIVKDPNVPALRAKGFKDVEVISPTDFVDALADSMRSVSPAETIIITRSNKRANNINMQVRNLVLDADDVLIREELLVVSKNNYHWTKNVKDVGFLANGESIVVDWFGEQEQRYGHTFVDIEFRIAGNPRPLAGKLLVNSLLCEGPSLSAQDMDKLRAAVLADMEGSPMERLMAVETNDYYNAIQAKYAYAVTCHKAQGGQWADVYIDLSAIMADSIDLSYYRWLYTALTRATRKVGLVNPSVPVVE